MGMASFFLAKGKRSNGQREVACFENGVGAPCILPFKNMLYF
jgi:hypothetical protein